MAELRITERKFNTEGFGGAYQIEGPFVAHQKVTIDTEAKSNAVSDETEYVSLFAEVKCYISIGKNPTAVDGQSDFLAAGERTQRTVKKGDKISVVAAT